MSDTDEKLPWMINQNTYCIDGKEIPKGRMFKMQKGQRPIINTDWRRATKKEVETKQWFKGNYFNLNLINGGMSDE